MAIGIRYWGTFDPRGCPDGEASKAEGRPAFGLYAPGSGWQDHFTLRLRTGIESLDDEIGPVDAVHGAHRTPQGADECAVADWARMLGQREMVLFEWWRRLSMAAVKE